MKLYTKRSIRSSSITMTKMLIFWMLLGSSEVVLKYEIEVVSTESIRVHSNLQVTRDDE